MPRRRGLAALPRRSMALAVKLCRLPIRHSSSLHQRAPVMLRDRQASGLCQFRLSQWPGKAQFVAVRISQVKEPLAPLSIARCRIWS